jgi:hypothetical protein
MVGIADLSKSMRERKMKSEYVVALVLRILGLLLAFQAVMFLPYLIMTFSGALSEDPAIWSHIWPQVIGLSLSLAAAYLLFMHGGWLARCVVPEDEQLDFGDMPLENADTIPLFRLLLRVVGAFALAWSVPELAGQGFASIKVYRFSSDQVWTQLVPGLLKFVIGLYLLRGGDHLIRFAYSVDAAPQEEISE